MLSAACSPAPPGLGRIDIVVNNAGFGYWPFGSAEENSDDPIRHHIGTNLGGSIQIVRADLPFLRCEGGGVRLAGVR